MTAGLSGSKHLVALGAAGARPLVGYALLMLLQDLANLIRRAHCAAMR